MATMRAIRQHALGGPEVLRLEEVPRPEPRATEVLVRGTAAGVNPVDWKTRMRGGLGDGLPFTVGWDVAGVVAELGPGVARFEVGDRVFGMPRFPHLASAYAEYVASPSRHLARTPTALTDVEAAALPLVGLTAWQALVETADVQPGERVLVHAAAGGVGHVAVQIAKARGAYVIGTASAAKHDFLAELGVDEAVDYTAVDVADAVRDVDVALDTVGGDTASRSLPVVRDGGRLVTISSGAEAAAEQARGRVSVRFMLVEPDAHGLEELAALVDAGKLRVHVSQTFPLAEAGRAHEVSESGRTVGKIVLTTG